MMNAAQRQYVLLGVILLALSVSAVLAYGLLKDKAPRLAPPKPTPKSLVSGVSRVNPQEVWVHDLSHKLNLTTKRLEALEKALEQLLKLNEKREDNAKVVSTTSTLTTPAGALKEELGTLHPKNPASVGQTLPPPPTEGVFASNGLPPLRRESALKKISLSLHGKRNLTALKTTDNTIPAGSFAEARLLGGVDASTSIQASSDPRPILLRLTHPGTLPRRFQSDLKGCHVLAASYGDISSERVFMRLEKLSCVERKTGEVLDLPVQGYVAGEDGRAGIRGVVVDKAGAHMRNAMVGGFFSSVGKFLGQARTPLLFSPQNGFAQQNALTGADIFKQSAGQGLGGALDKYADFYIKRAEQMQPVIQVAAGRKVDIVFTQGLDFSGSQLRKSLSQSRDKERFQHIQNLHEQKSAPYALENEGEME